MQTKKMEKFLPGFGCVCVSAHTESLRTRWTFFSLSFFVSQIFIVKWEINFCLLKRAAITNEDISVFYIQQNK